MPQRILVAGMADADTHPPVVVADVLADRAQAVVPGNATADFDPDFAWRQLDLIVEYRDVIKRELKEMRRLGDGTAGFIHIGAGQEQQHARAADRPFTRDPLETAAPRPKAVALRDRLDRHEADVVAVADIARSRISESDQEQHRLRPACATSLLLGRSGGRRRSRAGRRSGSTTGRRARSRTGCCTFGRHAGGGRSSRRSGGSGSLGRSFHLFRIARRRHHRDQGNVFGGHNADALRQRNIAEVLGVVDLELADVDLDSGRDGVSLTAHFDAVGHDADRSAAFDARRLVGVLDVDRDIDTDRRALAEPHEVYVQREITDGIELEIPRNDAVFYAVDLDVMNGREKTPGINALAQIAVFERDWQRRLAVAVDDSGHAAGATLRAGGPLAG